MRGTYSVLYVALVLLGLILCTVGAQECTASDYDAQYTQCRPDGSHDLVYYKKKGVNCTGGVDLPSPLFDLPCNVTCGDGKFLPLGEVVCKACPTGSFSRGGARIVDDWHSWPTNLGVFTTSCIWNLEGTPTNCSGWTLDPEGLFIRSGNITDAQSSILDLQFQLVVPGHFRFTYRVDAEINYDYLIFSLDKNVTIPKASITTGYVSFVAPLSAGYHTARFEYFKDRTLKQGQDAAFIQSIEIAGLSYAESSCTSCPVGTYTGAEGAVTCDKCAINSFAAVEGTSTCSPCPDGQYSYLGSATCFPRPACTANDTQVLFGACSGGVRTGTYSWLEPRICDLNATLPASITAACLPCNPGTTADASGNCVPCDSGKYSNGVAACAACAAGYVAPRTFYRNSFNSWLPSENTWCTGDCGTAGWRLKSGYIDSGAGHGSVANSYYQLNLTVERPGVFSFVFQFNCNNKCSLSIVDYPFVASTTFNQGVIYANGQNYTYIAPAPLEVGTHSFLFNFAVNSYIQDDDPRNNSVMVYNIQANGTVQGGAIQCLPCGAGSVSNSAGSVCVNCLPGQSNNTEHTQCANCAGNTFSRTADACHNCGAGTTVNSAHTDCVNPCSVTFGSDFYDLSVFAKNGVIGPIDFSTTNYYYYINLCARGNLSTLCIDDDGVPLNTHVCQILPQFGTAKDLGFLPAYYPAASGDYGFTVSFEMGELGCGPVTRGSNYPRVSTIDMICDPMAGMGSLQPQQPLENPPCNYNFEWRSLYACPVCNPTHYSYYYTPCEAGTRQKMYYWNENPVHCHDGVALPAPENVPCIDSTVECGVGERLAENLTCVACGEGEYSVGGDLVINSWPTMAALPYDYETGCDLAPCTQWNSIDGFVINSGFGDSYLRGFHTYRLGGEVRFEYKLFSSSAGYFQFSIDGSVVYRSTTGESVLGWSTLSFPVPAGNHYFEWRFYNGERYSPTLLNLQGISIRTIYLTGIDYHSDSCFPCPSGTYASADRSGCVTCPMNTFSTGKADSCTECSNTTYSFPGSMFCSPRTNCTQYNWELAFGPCMEDGTRSAGYIKREPDTCIGGYRPPTVPGTAPCAPCPPSTTRQGANCVGCPSGQYFNTATNECSPNVAGNLVQRVSQYFNDNTSYTLPDPFTTSCTGLCGSAGWGAHGSYIDSGYHSTNNVDSYLYLPVDIVSEGSISFRYRIISNGTSNGLQFFIDNDSIPINTTPSGNNSETEVLLPLPFGVHKLTWNYHQESGFGLVAVRNIVVVGLRDAIGTLPDLKPCPPGQYASDASAVQCSVCGAGSHSSSAGSTSCALCPINTYNPYPGQGECTQCGLGSYTTEAGGQRCVTDCIFSLDNKKYDLSKTGTVEVYDNQRQLYYISVCDVVGDACPSSHACKVGVNGNVSEIGNSFELVPRNSTTSPFAIYFSEGTSEMCADGSTTIIQFECDANAGAGAPNFLSYDDERCVYSFNWRSVYACAACTDTDYQVVKGVCSGGKRQISKTRITNCNGPLTMEVPAEKCSAQEFPTGAVVAVVIVFVAVVAIAGFIIWRNRRLAAQYNSLVEETRSNPQSI